MHLSDADKGIINTLLGVSVSVVMTIAETLPSCAAFEYKDGKTKVIEIVKEIKNTKSPSGSTPTGNSPKTGDSTNIWLPILLAVLSACGIGGVIWYKKKKGN